MFNHNGEWQAIGQLVAQRVSRCCLLLLLVLSMSTTVLAQEGEADPGLPDRPPPKVLPVRPEEPDRDGPINEGGHIELQINPGADIWTEVEWQGGDGEWHVVEGWRGYTSTGGLVRWFVKSSDLRKGPYRWQIYLYEAGDYLATSEPFFLPTVNGDKVTLQMDVANLAAYFY